MKKYIIEGMVILRNGLKIRWIEFKTSNSIEEATEKAFITIKSQMPVSKIWAI